MLVECKACGGQISRKATSCRKCGHPNERVVRQLLALIVVGVAVGISLIWWRISKYNDSLLVEETAQVASLIHNYSMVKNEGDAHHSCLLAGLIANTYASFGNNDQHHLWKQTQAEDCQARKPASGA